MTLRPGLKWLLGATMALSLAAVLLNPSPNSSNSAMRWAPSPAIPRGDVPSLTTPHSPESVRPLPERIDPQRFEPAAIDLFAGDASSAAPAAEPPSPTPAILTVPSQASPAAAVPPPAARFLGRFVTPEGTRLVFLRDGEQSIVAAPGAVLSNGYTVQALLPESPADSTGGAVAAVTAIRLVHTASGQLVEISLPADLPADLPFRREP